MPGSAAQARKPRRLGSVGRNTTVVVEHAPQHLLDAQEHTRVVYRGDGVLGLGITSSGTVSIDQFRHYAGQAGKYMNQA
jgi:hypothetical protein